MRAGVVLIVVYLFLSLSGMSIVGYYICLIIVTSNSNVSVMLVAYPPAWVFMVRVCTL